MAQQENLLEYYDGERLGLEGLALITMKVRLGCSAAIKAFCTKGDGLSSSVVGGRA
jgi:hypothetical protein